MYLDRVYHLGSSDEELLCGEPDLRQFYRVREYPTSEYVNPADNGSCPTSTNKAGPYLEPCWPSAERGSTTWQVTGEWPRPGDRVRRKLDLKAEIPGSYHEPRGFRNESWDMHRRCRRALGPVYPIPDAYESRNERGKLSKGQPFVVRVSDLDEASTPTTSVSSFKNSGFNKPENGAVSHDLYEQSPRGMRSGSGVEKKFTRRSMSIPPQTSKGNFRIDRTCALPKHPMGRSFERASESGCGFRPHSASHSPFRCIRKCPQSHGKVKLNDRTQKCSRICPIGPQPCYPGWGLVTTYPFSKSPPSPRANLGYTCTEEP